MAHVRKSTEELIAEEEKKAEQVKARMTELKARQRVEERKRDNHRKIIVGAAVIAHIKIDPRYRKATQEALNKAVPDPKHRAVIPDLLDERSFIKAMRAAARKQEEEAKEAKAAAANEQGAGSAPGPGPQPGKGGPESQEPPSRSS
jgi:hypothetical protein